MSRKADIFQTRMDKHHDELKWLYMELYGNGDMFAELCSPDVRILQRAQPEAAQPG